MKVEQKSTIKALAKVSAKMGCEDVPDGVAKSDYLPAYNEALKQQELNALGFDALLKKIATARQDIKRVRDYVAVALRLALKDYCDHNNKNSLQQLCTTPVDSTIKGTKIYLYNLYNVKDYLTACGLKLDYTAKDGFTVFFREGCDKKTVMAFSSYAEWLPVFKSEQASKRAKDKKSPYEVAKEACKALSIDDLQKLLAVLKR